MIDYLNSFPDLKYKDFWGSDNIATFLWESLENSLEINNLLKQENKIQEIDIWENLKINKLKVWNYENENILILFPSIKWNSKFYVYNDNMNRFELKNENQISIHLQYKTSTDPKLNKTIEFNNTTNLVNYY